MKIADPYPVTDPSLGGDLTPVVDVSFYDVEVRISRLNLDDPQPPGYAYRLPLRAEYGPWVGRRNLVVAEEAYDPREEEVDRLPVTQTRQEISYYDQGIWFHVGGSVFSWCSNPVESEGRRVFSGGAWFNTMRRVRDVFWNRYDPNLSSVQLGFRLVRGPAS